jgi:hypothetical protein
VTKIFERVSWLTAKIRDVLGEQEEFSVKQKKISSTACVERRDFLNNVNGKEGGGWMESNEGNH